METFHRILCRGGVWKAAVLTFARLFDKFGGGSIRVIECVLQKAEAQLLHN